MKFLLFEMEFILKERGFGNGSYHSQSLDNVPNFLKYNVMKIQYKLVSVFKLYKAQFPSSRTIINF